MKTRRQKKHFLSSMLFVSLLMGSYEAQAQFNKYRSQTRFNTNPGNALLRQQQRMVQLRLPRM
jgi:hypothetical protein